MPFSFLGGQILQFFPPQTPNYYRSINPLVLLIHILFSLCPPPILWSHDLVVGGRMLAGWTIDQPQGMSASERYKVGFWIFCGFSWGKMMVVEGVKQLYFNTRGNLHRDDRKLWGPIKALKNEREWKDPKNQVFAIRWNYRPHCRLINPQPRSVSRFVLVCVCMCVCM